ncbi:hypothetical protein [Agrococcus sp. SGAir0287]|uniref:hypothetical protein n=1 Tax=Agrococcus sp. SGAir0287 TaxID=2070347 RepID=UPI0010CD1BCA|nr:hypothetical protein [Agrococcus sp. SGAir0287]QCR19841.1 hypothetical protein C1N71_10705 [Agrococcus sp. SGAir0287]
MTWTTRRRHGIAIGLAALAAMLAGCATAQDPGAQETSASPSAAASASPTPTPTPTPSPSQEPAAEPAQCSDAYVVRQTSQNGFANFQGSEQEVLAQAQPRGGFVHPDALASLDVLCAVTYLAPTSGGPGIVEISVAFVAPGPEAEAQLAAWASANGYEPYDMSTPYAERSQPAEANGDTTRKILFSPLSRFGGPDALSAEEWSQLVGVPVTLDTLMVSHSDFTIPQG